MGTLDSTNTDTVTTDSDAGFTLNEDWLRQAAQALDGGADSVDMPEPNHGGSTAADEVVEPSSIGDGLARPSSKEGGDKNSQSTDNAEHNEAQQEDSKPDSDRQEPKESNYSKAKKNAERFDRNWRKLQEQQAELAKQRAELAAREAQLHWQTPAQSTQQQQPTVAQSGDSPARYEEAAEEWEREGKFDLAELARAKAAALKRSSASQPQVQAPVPQTYEAGVSPPRQGNGAATPGSPQFIQTWNENLRALEAEADFTDLRNRDSALYKATAGVLQEDARLSYFPDGIRLAARIAKLRVEAGAVPELQTKVQAYEQELAKLRAATSPSRGAPNSRGGAKSFEEMSTAEQERELMRLAQEVDGA